VSGDYAREAPMENGGPFQSFAFTPKIPLPGSIQKSVGIQLFETPAFATISDKSDALMVRNIMAIS